MAEKLVINSPLFDLVDKKNRVFLKVPVAPYKRDQANWINAAGHDHGASEPQESRNTAVFEGLPDAIIVLDPMDYIKSLNTAACSWFNMTRDDIGRPFHELSVSFRPAELRSVIEEARTSLRTISRNTIDSHSANGKRMSLDIEVRPLRNAQGQQCGTAIRFSDTTDLEQTRTELKQVQEDLETTSEELQSSNEELETTNEELQSTNEELETMNEELQSSNEELESMNKELQSVHGGGNDMPPLTRDNSEE